MRIAKTTVIEAGGQSFTAEEDHPMVVVEMCDGSCESKVWQVGIVGRLQSHSFYNDMIEAGKDITVVSIPPHPVHVLYVIEGALSEEKFTCRCGKESRDSTRAAS